MEFVIAETLQGRYNDMQQVAGVMYAYQSNTLEDIEEHPGNQTYPTRIRIRA
jgi:hypothetical protein